MLQLTRTSGLCVIGGRQSLCQQARKTVRPQRNHRQLCTAQRQARRDAMQDRQRNKEEKLRVLRLISACVESNVSIQSS